MGTELKLRRWLTAAALLEALIWAAAYFQYEDPGEVFRHAARWSGRLSLVVFLVAFHVFATNFRRSEVGMRNAHRALIIFCVMHFIHLGFVALNVHLNAIALVPYKLVGGALAYALILVYPFVFDKVGEKKAVHLAYFVYVGAVMAITIIARIRGDFVGAEPSLFHYIGLAAIVLMFVVNGRVLLRKE